MSNVRAHKMSSSPPALIIIDMQCGMSGPSAGRRNNAEAEAHIASLLAAWRAANFPVVHVKHVSRTPGSPFWPDQVGVEFQPQFVPTADEYIVEKSVPDAFINTGLERWLRARGIAQLFVCGVSTNISVESSTRTAGNLGFQVTVVSDATFAFEKPDYDGVTRTAEEVHAMSLANLKGEFATLAKTTEVLSAL